MEARILRAALFAAVFFSAGAGYRTDNFVVNAPTAELAQEIGHTAEECRRFAWSLPVGVAVVGMEREALVRENARLAREFTPLSDVERRALLDRIAPRRSLALEPYKQNA